MGERELSEHEALGSIPSDRTHSTVLPSTAFVGGTADERESPAGSDSQAKYKLPVSCHSLLLSTRCSW